MKGLVDFAQVARLPAPGDNVAIATRRLDAGSVIALDEHRFKLEHTILEGHRFAVRPIEAGQPLLSWGLPFGLATGPIPAGAAVCNAGMIEALSTRHIVASLPDRPNFADRIVPFYLDAPAFIPAGPLPLHPRPPSFKGYDRGKRRGVGTRNCIVLLGTSSATAGFVRRLEERLAGLASERQAIDGIVAVAHTEGAKPRPNNRELVLRTLAGFMVHPNAGAVLAVDQGWEAVNNAVLAEYMSRHGYPLEEVVHRFYSLARDFEASLAEAEAIVKGWLPVVEQARRSELPAGHLKIALQCGGSDAFSGISGNPLAAWVAREIIAFGGAANLAETPELIGAEGYVLQKVRDLETAGRFLAAIERFKARAARHGMTVEANTSGGNKLRGLYNITLKSIGAAMKRHPDLRLDYVTEYAEPLPGPGLTFMDSPGLDLESVAGQVAAGCNLIFFVTGNGSITNFPFVPTIKIVTTTERFRLLEKDMDVNAGAYLDGRSMDELGQEMLRLTLDVASGQATRGEAAGHAQVQIWRDWPRPDSARSIETAGQLQPIGKAIPIKASDTLTARALPAIRVVRDGQVGLILPTSLCAGQIALMAAERLNGRGLGREMGITRFAGLAHTEGCASSSGRSGGLFTRVLLGYLLHPLAGPCLLLEHGCEVTHNDYFRHQLELMGEDPERFGWASIQMDGGIEEVLAKIETWFEDQVKTMEASGVARPDGGPIRLGLHTTGRVDTATGLALARVSRRIIAAGGTVVVPQNAELLAAPAYCENLIGQRAPRATLAYGGRPASAGSSQDGGGLHIMSTPTRDLTETITGLAACGTEVILQVAVDRPGQAHPLVPVVQATAGKDVWTRYEDDLDLLLDGDPETWPERLLQLAARALSGEYVPKMMKQENVGFQISRGLLGISF